MIERIVVAMDGSMLSREAFEHAAQLARAGDLPLQVLHVREPVGAAVPAGPPDDGGPGIRAALDGCRRSARLRGQEIDVVVRDGVLTAVLDETADRHTLTVVGLQGRFTADGIGATTRWLVQHARGPILVMTGPSQFELSRVLAVADGTPPSARAVEVARDLALRTGWPLTVQAIAVDVPVERVICETSRLVPDVQIFSNGSLHGGAADQIAAVAQKYQHVLPVLGAHPDSWLHQVLRGGTSGHLLRQLWAPIILVP
jgi:nucleotide-binding universal stress UspA family protein